MGMKISPNRPGRGKMELSNVDRSDTLYIEGDIKVTPVGSTLTNIGKQVQVLFQTETVDFGAVGDGYGSSATVTVTGAALGDFVTVAPVDGDLGDGIRIEGVVTAANTVRLTALDLSLTGGADLSEQDFNIRVERLS